MATILQVASWVTIDDVPYVPGIYEVAEGKAGDGQIERAVADKLLEAHPNEVKQFKDNEPIANLIEWKKQNVAFK